MPAVIDYIEKQQNMPLEIRDWSKANRYQEAYEFITNTGNDLSSSATFGDSSMIQNKSLLIDVLCSYLEEAEERKIVAESLRAELIRLNQLNAGALTWEAHLCEKQQTTQAYLNELLGVKNVSDDKTEQKFLSQNQMTKDSLVERGIAKRNELTNSTALLSALESQYGEKKRDTGNKDHAAQSRGAFRGCTLAQLIKMKAIAKVDFGKGVLKLQSSNIDGTLNVDKNLAMKIQYIFANEKNRPNGNSLNSSSSLVINNVAAVQQAAGTSIGDKSGVGDSLARTQPESGSSDVFTVTSIYDGNYVIDTFQLSTDELVSFDNSSLSEFRPTGSSTTFFVPQLLSFMKELQLVELLKRISKKET